MLTLTLYTPLGISNKVCSVEVLPSAADHTQRSWNFLLITASPLENSLLFWNCQPSVAVQPLMSPVSMSGLATNCVKSMGFSNVAEVRSIALRATLRSARAMAAWSGATAATSASLVNSAIAASPAATAASSSAFASAEYVVSIAFAAAIRSSTAVKNSPSFACSISATVAVP